jgi:predicted TIM-barrel fold metal-dependent hydrolase
MAQTSWGDLPVADAHVHFFSHRFYESLAVQKKLPDASALVPLLSWEIPEPEPAALAARWVKELDRRGVARAALIASVPEDESSVEGAVAAYPERFFGYFMLDPTRPGALERTRQTLGRKYLRCLALFPAMHGYSITDPRLVPILECAADYRAAVFVHCGALSVGIRKKLGLPSPFDMRYSNPIDLHPVALHFPQIRFIVPHFGAGYLREALMLADLAPNVYLDTSSSNRWMAYDPSGLDLRTVFRRALEVVGPSRLLFGTDSSFFPRGWQTDVFEQQTKVLYELALDEPDVRMILHDNLVALFGAKADG